MRKLSLTNWIIILNVAVFIAASLIISFSPSFINYVALNPAFILQGKYLWTFLTSMFMHANIPHIALNMISLFFIGNLVERLIGRKRFLAFYILSGLVAGIFFVLLAALFGMQLDISAVGASGAIFGLGGLLAVLTPKLPVLVFFIIPMPMWLAMIFLLVALWIISLLSGLLIGNTAHLGGLIVGLVYGLYLRRRYKRKVRALNRYFR